MRHVHRCRRPHGFITTCKSRGTHICKCGATFNIFTRKWQKDGVELDAPERPGKR